MPDPFFDVAVWEIRGFDLGDDEELRTALEDRDDRNADDRLLLAILRMRAGSTGVTDELEAAARTPEREGIASYLLAQLALDQGKLDEARSFLDRTEQADPANVASADLLHARGTLARLSGDPLEAVRLYREALELDPRDDGRWRALADLLRDLSKHDKAIEALRSALELDPESAQTRYEIAATAAAAGDAATAAGELAAALQRDETLRDRAAHDERLTAVSNPQVQALLRPPSVDETWLDAFPPWLQDLRLDRGAQELGLTWIDRERSRAMSQQLERAYERGPLGTLHTTATLTLSRRLLRSRKAVAFGPSVVTREGRRDPSVLFIDVHEVDRLYLAPSQAHPPFLWIDVGTTAESIEGALRGLFVTGSPSRLSLHKRARGFMGYRLRFGVPNPYGRDPEPANALELDRHFSLSPFLDTGAWGSAYADDPWPETIPVQPELVSKLAHRQQRMTGQAEGAVWSMTRRTRHSRSQLRLELHQRDLFVLDVRYQPSPFCAVVESVNDEFGCDYPTDMPLDVVAALIGFQFDSADDVQVLLESTADAEQIAGLLAVLAALRYDDLGAVRLYRRYMDHPEAVVRTSLCNIFADYNMESLLEEMTVLETDAELRDEIEALLDEGLAPSDVDPYRDYELEDEDDDDDDDDQDPRQIRADLRTTADVPEPPPEDA